MGWDESRGKTAAWKLYGIEKTGSSTAVERSLVSVKGPKTLGTFHVFFGLINTAALISPSPQDLRGGPSAELGGRFQPISDPCSGSASFTMLALEGSAIC